MPWASGGVVVLLIAVLYLIGVANRWDRGAWDLLSRELATTEQPDSSILLVAVDQAGLDFFAENQVLWPWPRDLWGHLVYLAQKNGAKGVLFDVLFDDAGIDRLNSDGASTDAAFARWLGTTFPVVIAAQTVSGGLPLDSLPVGLRWTSDKLRPFAIEMDGLRLPNARFRHAEMGLTNVTPETDGVIRWVPLVFNTEGAQLPSLTLKLLHLVYGDSCPTPDLDDQGRFWLRYYGPGGNHGVFPYISAAAIITGRISAEKLRGKLLVVGGFASGLLDYKPTPVAAPQHPYPGFEIHATVLSNILQGDELKPISRLGGFFYLLLLGILSLVGMRLAKKAWTQLALLPIILLLTAGLAVYAYFESWLIPVVPSMIASFGGVGALWFSEWRLEGQQRRRLRQLFGRYLHDGVIDELLHSGEEVDLTGHEAEVVIMFADLVGFTSASESLTPKQVVSMLNTYYENIVEIILRHHGFLDKFIGDAIMVLFGAPKADDTACERAAEAVISVMSRMREMNEERSQQGLPTLEMRFGLHLDSVIVGNIGHHNRMDYTAIGSGVNIASRLEGANRMLGTGALISSSFERRLPDRISRRRIGRVTLKGLTTPLEIFELLPATTAQGDGWMKEWNEAWSEWQEGQRNDAQRRFQDLLKDRSDDQALKLMLDRLEPFVHSHGGEDDVVSFKTK
ncbi:MAG: adenylate/guanylate cyclase domain-containing protein [bacterium]